MRITWQRCGGVAFLPGLQQPLVVDVDSLPGPQARALRALVDEAGFAALPATVDLPQAGADRQHDVLTVDDDVGALHHTVQVGVPGGSPALRALVQAVRQHARAVRGGAA